MEQNRELASAARDGTAGEVFRCFLGLGLTSFGGPVAHLGYFRLEFVTRRRWLDEAAFAELVGLCQFLPGPASSQTGFAVGLLRAGLPGALAAWTGFTLPSALLMLGFARAEPWLSLSRGGLGVLHGLQLAAVAIVAQAVWSMARSLCPDRARAGIGLASLAVATLAPAALGQVAALASGAAAGLVLCRDEAAQPAPAGGPLSGRYLGLCCLGLFAALLMLPPLQLPGMPVFGAFYRSGALVFGGGHVVLPLLRAALVAPGWLSERMFMAGYGAAQALPGPLFTLAAYLGAVLQRGPGGVQGAMLALVAIFLPGLLLVLGVLPFWAQLRRHRLAWRALRGVNAAVVGVLGAALYDPIWTGTVRQPSDFVLAVCGFVALLRFALPPLGLVACAACAGYVLAAAGPG